LFAQCFQGELTYLFYIELRGGGEGGIRTHVGLRPNRFRVGAVMTASVPLLNEPRNIRNTRDFCQKKIPIHRGGYRYKLPIAF
jgi:hypothetical protein